MAFDTRKITPNLEPFEFIDLDGESHEMPNFSTLTGDQTARLKAGDESVIEEICDEDTVAAFEAMPMYVQMQVAQAWAEHAGAVGKAAPRSSRPRSTPKRSRSTSR
ncbi:hypothetical protein ABZ135_18410 [Streptomyces sp. NPDC006339]|uniref:hypothetical protein n=1 Tax=Streptomyces sp. NPDC006339 TaxID=3156755 RepID=UPI0033BB5D79